MFVFLSVFPQSYLSAVTKCHVQVISFPVSYICEVLDLNHDIEITLFHEEFFMVLLHRFQDNIH
jgi:hypothetical protein